MEQISDQNTPVKELSEDKPVAEAKSDEVLKTPVRPGRGTKRKHPDTPVSTPTRAEDGGSVKKRRRSSSSVAMSRVGSPGTTLLKPALTERQQMALLLQMTDPNKHQSPGSPAVSSGPATPEVTPKRLQRKNERGETPLHLAAIKGDVKAVTSLLRQGADVKVTDHAGWTPLHEACNYGHSVVARELLAHGAEVGAVGMDGDTPMHDAAVNGHLETVRLLLQNGGNPYHANEKGLTPIDVCTRSDILDLLKSHEQDHTHTGRERSNTGSERSHTGSESSNRDTEENPCPKRSHSSGRESVDVTDKEELSPVFSPDRAPVAMTTPTQQAVTTPIRAPPAHIQQMKKTRLRGVSFSDISSSESELEPIGDDKECEKDGPVSTIDEEVLPVEKATDESKDELHKINGNKLVLDDCGVESAIIDEKTDTKESSSELEPDKKIISSPERDHDTQPIPPAEDPPNVSTEQEERLSRLEAPGHDSRVGLENETDNVEEMLMSIPLSAVKLPASHERREAVSYSSDEAKGSMGDWQVTESKGTSPPNPAFLCNSDSGDFGQSAGGEDVTLVGSEGVGHTMLSCKRAVKEGRKERTTQEEDEPESFSISLGRNSIKSPTDTTPFLRVSHGPIRTQSKDSPDYVRTPDRDPPQSNSAEPNNTVISFRTSLPLVFSHSTPPTTVSRLAVSESKSLSSPSSPDGGRVSSGMSTPDTSFRRSGSQDSLSMPPKMRHRPVIKSAVIRQRINHTPQAFDSTDVQFLSLLGMCRSREPVTPASPKTVYPPLPSSLHKQFSEQEAERARLATTHTVEQDRLRLSLVQELLRAHQRAKKGQSPSLSASSLLLEKFLPPPMLTECGLKVETEHRPRESEDGLHSRLLSGLVQDVWDKFQALKFSLLSRQRHEAEALWLVQREQWLCAREELGDTSLSEVPLSHVPPISPCNFTAPLPY